MANTWILIANASEAHLYSSPKAKLFNGNAKLDLLEDFDHPDSRKKLSELVSDRLGRTIHGTYGRTLHGSYMEPSDLKKIEADHFAQKLTESLEHGRMNNEFQELILIAPGHFQSMLKQHASQPLYNMIERSIDRDYTHCPPKNLVSQIQEWL